MKTKILLATAMLTFGVSAETQTHNVTTTGSVVNDQCTLIGTPTLDLGALDGAALASQTKISRGSPGGNADFYDTGIDITVTANCTPGTNYSVGVDSANPFLTSSTNTLACIDNGVECEYDFTPMVVTTGDGTNQTFTYSVYIGTPDGFGNQRIDQVNESISFNVPFHLITQ